MTIVMFVVLSGEVNLRSRLREVAKRDTIIVVVSKHALTRFRERKVDQYYGPEGKLLENIVVNTLRSGRVLIGRSSFLVIASRYALACTVDERGVIVVKTVMRASDILCKLGDRVKKLRESPFSNRNLITILPSKWRRK